MGDLLLSSDGIAYDEGLTDYANNYKKTLQCEILQEVRQEIAQIKATKIYSTIDLKDMVLEILDRHIKGKVDV